MVYREYMVYSGVIQGRRGCTHGVQWGHPGTKGVCGRVIMAQDQVPCERVTLNPNLSPNPLWETPIGDSLDPHIVDLHAPVDVQLS